MTPGNQRKAIAQTGKRSAGKHKIQIKRVYDEASPGDGLRFLVDRLWPRGVKKSALAGVQWLKDVAPGTPLREWFGHEPAKWTEFQKRYRAELKESSNAWKPLLDTLKKSNLTLLYGAKDREINHAVVLKDFLAKKKA